MSAHSPPSALRRLARSLSRDAVFLTLLAALVVFSVVQPAQIEHYPALVDWQTLGALAGLLVLTRGVEASGALHRAGDWLLGFMRSERGVALSLVTAAAALSTVLTNDVALFVVVPLTLGICRLAGLHATRYILFEALAVNVGSALTPIGNPQNLFLWQRSGATFLGFVQHMLPLVAALMVALLLLTTFAFRATAVKVERDDTPPALDRLLLVASLALYVPFLVLADLHLAVAAFVAVALLFGLLRPRVLGQVDWGLLLVFALMFIDLRLLAGLPVVREFVAGLGLQRPQALYLAAIGASQIVSNVPAAIALAESSSDWRVLAYGVNVGGFGLFIGSLANLIALRMAGDRKAWVAFHLWALPALAVATGVGWLLLFPQPFGD